VRLAAPQPYEEIPHTADLGLAARGASPEEALARLALALGAVLAGPGAPPAATGAPVRVRSRGGSDRAQAGAALLRELLFRFATRREIPVEVEVLELGPAGAVAEVRFGRWDAQRNLEGTDVKAVTWHDARLEPDGGGFRAQVILDT
jgi:SHS2 domain-containing protein